MASASSCNGKRFNIVSLNTNKSSSSSSSSLEASASSL